jgi:SMI1 / KNR4 family (SUKH-1)
MTRVAICEERPPASPDALASTDEALAALGQRIPPSYRAFLAEQDGGRPVDSRFEFPDGDDAVRVQCFLGVGPSPVGDLVSEARGFAGRVIPGMLPIAVDSLGNLVLLDGRDGGDGPVWFWDHELEAEDTPDESNLTRLAPDLASFLDGLHAPPPPPQPSPEPPKRGLRRLFGG